METTETLHNLDLASDSTRKPRLALMGEFSAGKSTLTNLLLGSSPVPTRVTATRLPPVWVSYGDAPAERIDLDGVSHPMDVSKIDRVDMDNTRMVRLYLKCDTLELCDLIDLPGISDPNMPPEVWQMVMDDVDTVVWCTHATQAWRQSEAAVWDDVRAKTCGNNLLLITQIDKLKAGRDRDRVMARVRKETQGLFSGHYAVSLLDAMKAGDDCEAWARSGAADFTEHLIEILLSPETSAAPVQAYVPSDDPAPQADAAETEAVAQTEEPEAQDADGAVLPKRVRRRPNSRLRSRPVAGNDTEAEMIRSMVSASEASA